MDDAAIKYAPFRFFFWHADILAPHQVRFQIADQYPSASNDSILCTMRMYLSNGGWCQYHNLSCAIEDQQTFVISSFLHDFDAGGRFYEIIISTRTSMGADDAEQVARGFEDINFQQVPAQLRAEQT